MVFPPVHDDDFYISLENWNGIVKVKYCFEIIYDKSRKNAKKVCAVVDKLVRAQYSTAYPQAKGCSLTVKRRMRNNMVKRVRVHRECLGAIRR